MKVELLNFDLSTKVIQKIECYKNWHEGDLPILLLSNDTLKYIKNKALTYINYDPNLVTSVELYGCKIAIANWIPFGEAELR